MVRNWVAPGLGLVVLPVLILTGCGPDQASDTTSNPPAEAAADAGTSTGGLELPCAPGSGRGFTDSGPMNLTDLSGADLDCALFDDQTMNQVKLANAKLSGAKFQSSTLNRVDLADATLIGAEFTDSTLNFADLSGADLSGADLQDAQLNNVDFTDATCPDGATADSGGCAGHLTPLDTAPGTAEPSQPAETAAEPEPSQAPPPAQDAPAAPAVFNDRADGTYRCQGGNVLINGAGSTVHLTGSCALVAVNGAGSDVEIDSAQRILVNGANATVTYHGSSQVVVSGAGAQAHPA